MEGSYYNTQGTPTMPFNSPSSQGGAIPPPFAAATPPPPPHFSYGYVPPASPYAYMAAPPMPPPPPPPPPQVQAFFNPWEPPPMPTPPPVDGELQKRIDKLAEYAAKNGPDFETFMKEKQKEDAGYAFLFGGEGHGYYRYKLWIMINHFMQPQFSPAAIPMVNAAPLALGLPAAAPGMAAPAFPQFSAPALPPPSPQQAFFEQGNVGGGVVQGSGVVPPEVLAEFRDRLDGLTGSQDSIQLTRLWFMQMPSFASALAEALQEKVAASNHIDRQMHALYLVNDILLTTLKLRGNVKELDCQALAFRPCLLSIFQAIYENSASETEREQADRILQFWGSKEVYDRDTIKALEREMKAILASKPEAPSSTAAASPERKPDQSHLTASSNSSGIQFTPSSSASHGGTSVLTSSQVPAATKSATEQQPLYPLFPPGLIPGMVRKMQIGSGVPYSALSSLDIPTAIPAATTSESYILERVNKFFKDIGEADPLAGENMEFEQEQEMEERGGARIPPPQLQFDPETGTLADGSVEHRPGMSSTGRLGLGAAADPNEASQYDDVYTSYRKQRSTNYHTSLSARAAAAAAR